MDRALEILRKTVERIEGCLPFAVALVIDAEGSTPRKQGVRAIFDAGGGTVGTIGGGRIEADAQRRGVEACRSGKPGILEVSLQGAEPEDEEPLCGGRVRILLDPTASKDEAAYRDALQAAGRRERGLLVTRIEGAGEIVTRTLWIPADSIAREAGFPGEAVLRACLDREAARLLCAERPEVSLEVFVEPVLPEPLLLIVGGGHIGQALARQASDLGFDVTVTDDRPEFTAPGLYPDGVTTRQGDVAREVAAFPKGPDTYIVIVTRGHLQDAAALAACIGSPLAYLGMIGSRRKVSLLRAELIESGRATEEQLARVFAPIGLDIGAVTVPEIATSIAAQLVGVRRRGAAVLRAGSMAPP